MRDACSSSGVGRSTAAARPGSDARPRNGDQSGCRARTRQQRTQEGRAAHAGRMRRQVLSRYAMGVPPRVSGRDGSADDYRSGRINPERNQPPSRPRLAPHQAFTDPAVSWSRHRGSGPLPHTPCRHGPPGAYSRRHSVENPAVALAAVADAAQETVTERLWQAWPLCTEHDLGMHPLEAEGRLPRWCAGERRSTFVQLWASWTHSYARAAPTANGDTRTRDDPAGCCCGGGEVGGAGRGPLRAFVRRAVTAQRPCGIPAAVRPLSAAGGAVGHDSGAPGFRPRRCRAVVSPRGSPPGQWSLLTAVFVVVRKAVSGASSRSPIWPQRTRVTVRPSRPTENRWMSEMPICGSAVSRL